VVARGVRDGTLCFSADGLIVWSKHKCPGSWNDSDNSLEFRERLADPVLNPDPRYGVVADSAFPCADNMVGRIMTTLKEGDLGRLVPSVREVAQKKSGAITFIRQAAEWGMGSVEKGYGRLLHPLSYDKEKRKLRLDNCLDLPTIAFVRSMSVKSARRGCTEEKTTCNLIINSSRFLLYVLAFLHFFCMVDRTIIICLCRWRASLRSSASLSSYLLLFSSRSKSSRASFASSSLRCSSCSSRAATRASCRNCLCLVVAYLFSFSALTSLNLKALVSIGPASGFLGLRPTIAVLLEHQHHAHEIDAC
jgi:hypothetical protein